MSFRNQPPLIIKFSLPQPYSKSIKINKNKYGIPEKTYYSTGDICAILGYHPDTFRYRLRTGHYRDDFAKKGGKRIYTFDDLGYFVQRTKELKQNNNSFI